MNQPPTTSQTFTGDGSPLDPRQAAALLEQATQRARRTFGPGMPPQLWAFRAVLVLVAFGGCWLSVRGQDPYTGKISGWAIAVGAVFVAVNIGWSAWIIRRAGAGVSGPAQRRKQAWIGVMVAVLIVAYAVLVPLYHGGESHPAWGLYPASGPWLITGLIGVAVGAALHYRPIAGTTLAIAIVAAIAGFGGPAGAWLIMGIGMCAVCLGTAVLTASQQRRGVVQP